MKKILLATSAAIPKGGGIASYNQELLHAIGDEYQIFLLTESNEFDVIGFKETISTFGFSLSDYLFSKDLVKKINSENFDFIINSNSKFLTVLAPFVNAPIITVAHYFRGIMADESGYNSDYLAKIIVLSKSCKEYITNKFKVSPSKIDIVYNFVGGKNTKTFNNKLSKRPIKIVYPGGASIGKSSDVVIACVYHLLKSNLPFEFFWIGDMRTYAAKFSLLGLKTINDFFPVDSRLKLIGKVNRDEAERIIGSSNVFLLPSRGEGCPMTLLEAMREGCIPVISDANHGSLDVIKACGAGIVTKQNDGFNLFKAIEDVILNHDKYMDNYKKTFDYSMNVLSKEKWVEQMQQIFFEITKQRKISIKFTRKHFYYSLIPFRLLMIKHVVLTKFQILPYRIRVAISYLLLK